MDQGSVWAGVIPAILTPLDAAGKRLNSDVVKAYVDFLLDRGVNGFFVAGTTGEGVLLSKEERLELTRLVAAAAAKRAPVIMHVGSLTTGEATSLAREARGAGADAVAVVAPFYYGYDDEALYRHFAAVIEAADGLPTFLYNIPGNAKNPLKIALIRKLAERYSNLVGLKDSSKDLNQFQDYLLAFGDRLVGIIGTDNLILPSLVIGGKGVVSAVAAVYPEPVVELYRAFTAGDLVKARYWQNLVVRLRDVLKSGPNIAAYKKALEWRGISIGGGRPPLRPLNEAEERALRERLEGLNLSW